MRPFHWTLIAFAALALSAATCNRTEANAAPASAPGRAGAAEPSSTDLDRARRMLADIPGMDFSQLAPAAQKELASVLTDEFCYCGCPHTIGACLKSHATCRHAKRMTRLAAGYATEGVPGVEIVVELQKYYQAFREPRKNPKVDERMCHGAKDAKVTVVEFADFECPYCAAARPALEQFAKDNAARVRVCYSPFPLQGHPNSTQTAIAALFARDHGKFWEMHDLMFENQTSLSPEFIKELAGRVGLSPSELGRAFETKKYLDEVAAWKEAGKSAGIDSTPTIFMNGRKFPIVPRADTLNQSLDDELEWMSNHNAWAAD